MTRRVRSPSGKALYRVLPRQVAAMTAEQVAFHQRARLQGAMVAAVAEHGYQQVTIKELVALAGVSRTSFYKLFENKEACFLTTFDLIVSMASERIGRAYRSQDDWRAQMGASFQAFAEIIAEEPAAARLVLVDSLGAGRRALEHREAATETFEAMLAQSFARAPQPTVVSEATVQAIIAGIRRVAYRRLLAGEGEIVGELVDDLLAWATCYHAPGVSPPIRPPARNGKTATRRARRSRAARGQHKTPDGRQRILDAVVQIATREGYAALSMPAIAKQAGTSNATFYQHFNDKQEAFLTAFRESVRDGLAPSVQAFQDAPDWPAAIRGCLAALLEAVAADPAFANMAFFAILTGGPPAAQAAEDMLEKFASMFAPGHKQHPHVPAVVGEALIGGIWNLIQRELTNGRQAQLPRLAPEITYITLTPFIGAKRAARAAKAPTANGTLTA